jgi:hypothetical protein
MFHGLSAEVAAQQHPALPCPAVCCRGAFPSSVFLEVYIDGGFVTGEAAGGRRVGRAAAVLTACCFCEPWPLHSQQRC